MTTDAESEGDWRSSIGRRQLIYIVVGVLGAVGLYRASQRRGFGEGGYGAGGYGDGQ